LRRYRAAHPRNRFYEKIAILAVIMRFVSPPENPMSIFRREADLHALSGATTGADR
jgi:hypothetical protein